MDEWMSGLSFRTASVALGIFLFAGTAWAGGAWLYEGGGPDMGTAAAGRAALASDASTVFGNPAGMTQLDRSQLLLGVVPYFLTTKFDQAAATTVAGGNGGNAGGFAPLPAWGGSLPLSGTYGVYSLSPDVKLGFSLNSYAGGALDYDGRWAGRYYSQRADLLTLNFNPAVAYRVNEWLSVGVGFSVQYAKLVQKVAVNNILDRIPDARLIVRDADVGFGGNVGLLFTPQDGTRFGLTYRSQVDHDFKDSVSVDNLGPGLSAALAATDLSGSTVDLGMTVPQAVMFSGYHALTDTFAVMGNLGWQNWKQFGEVGISVASETTRDVTTDAEFNDTWHIALGAQYRLAKPWLLSVGFGCR